MTQPLEREFVRQYARAWMLLKRHAGGNVGDLTREGRNLLLDVINLRQRDLESLREGSLA